MKNYEIYPWDQISIDFYLIQQLQNDIKLSKMKDFKGVT